MGGRGKRCGVHVECALAATFLLAATRPAGDVPTMPAPHLPPSTLQVEHSYAHGETRSSAKPRGAIALTFDTEIPNGDEARRTLVRVLEILRDNGATATFFVTGEWVRANPAFLLRIQAAGHEVASHGLRHRLLAGRSAAEIARELDAVERAVRNAGGSPLAPFFRPPYGRLDRSGAAVAERLGYRVVRWTISGSDARRSTENALQVIDAVAPHLWPGEIVLLHTNRWITASALPAILQACRERELRPVALSELLPSWPKDGFHLAAKGSIRYSHPGEFR